MPDPSNSELAAEVAAIDDMYDASQAWRVHNTTAAVEGAAQDARLAALGGTATPWAKRSATRHA